MKKVNTNFKNVRLCRPSNLFMYYLSFISIEVFQLLVRNPIKLPFSPFFEKLTAFNKLECLFDLFDKIAGGGKAKFASYVDQATIFAILNIHLQLIMFEIEEQEKFDKTGKEIGCCEACCVFRQISEEKSSCSCHDGYDENVLRTCMVRRQNREKRKMEQTEYKEMKELHLKFRETKKKRNHHSTDSSDNTNFDVEKIFPGTESKFDMTMKRLEKKKRKKGKKNRMTEEEKNSYEILKELQKVDDSNGPFKFSIALMPNGLKKLGFKVSPKVRKAFKKLGKWRSLAMLAFKESFWEELNGMEVNPDEDIQFFNEPLFWNTVLLDWIYDSFFHIPNEQYSKISDHLHEYRHLFFGKESRNDMPKVRLIRKLASVQSKKYIDRFDFEKFKVRVWTMQRLINISKETNLFKKQDQNNKVDNFSALKIYQLMKKKLSGVSEISNLKNPDGTIAFKNFQQMWEEDIKGKGTIFEYFTNPLQIKKSLMFENYCSVCFRSPVGERESGEEGKFKLQKCGNCKVVYYCSVKCQKKDWKEHKLRCSELKKQMEKFKKSKSYKSLNFAAQKHYHNINKEKN